MGTYIYYHSEKKTKTTVYKLKKNHVLVYYVVELGSLLINFISFQLKFFSLLFSLKKQFLYFKIKYLKNRVS